MGLLLYLAGKISPKNYYRIESLRYKFPFIGRILSRVGNSIRNSDGLIQQGLGKGLKFNCGDSIAGYLLGTQEPQVQRALELLVRPGMIAFDLGANVGFLTLILSRLVGPEGKVVAVEPLEKNARRIEYNVSKNEFTNVQVRNHAIGGSDGKVVFRVSDFSTTGKLDSAQPEGAKGTALEVPLRSLDSLIAGGEAPAPDFIKMDVEGAEVETLRGATKLLAGRRPLMIIEVHDTNKAVNEILTASRYLSVVLGSKETLLSGHWNVQVLAFPEERPLSQEICDAITRDGV